MVLMRLHSCMVTHPDIDKQHCEKSAAETKDLSRFYMTCRSYLAEDPLTACAQNLTSTLIQR